MQFQWTSDIAHQFIDAAQHPLNGAYGFNFGTNPVSVAHVVELIKAAAPGAAITFQDNPLPFPPGCDGNALQQHLPQVYETPLGQGIEKTIVHFRQCVAANLITL